MEIQNEGEFYLNSCSDYENMIDIMLYEQKTLYLDLNHDRD